MLNITEKILNEFHNLCQVPRPSYNLDKVREYLKKFADEHKLSYKRDTYGNVVISPLLDDRKWSGKPIIIQSHMDMVCTKSDDSTHDFFKDPIEMVQDGNILRANKTTLGADNGLSMVASLILLNELKDQLTTPVYLLMTADEEAGLEGAKLLDTTPFLPADAYILNVDSEVGGKICAGSCGAGACHIKIEASEASATVVPEGVACYKMEMVGFKGGHSGIDINSGRASAIKCMAEFLQEVAQESKCFRLAELQGGNAHNAIPVKCMARFMVESTLDIQAKLQTYLTSIRGRFPTEDGVTASCETEKGCCGLSSFNDALKVLLSIRQGVVEMNSINPTCVETSNNIGVVKMVDKTIMDIECLFRSSNEASMRRVYSDISSAGKNVTPFECYLGWYPDWNTCELLQTLIRSYAKLFHHAANYQPAAAYSVHAGLETSELMKRYPKWIGMSIGPDIKEAHTWQEYVLIDSIEPFYLWMRETVLMLQST